MLVTIFGFSQRKYFDFNIYDGQDYLLTMSQSNNLYQNSLRYIGNEIDWNDLSAFEKKTYWTSVALFSSLVGQGITHEEGHRSVLTELGIGSINKPFVDKNLVLKVTGVSNQTLINLRNNDLPNYIRLHTSGLESDYAYLRKADSYFNYNEEEYTILYPDYLMRKLGVAFYFLSNLVPRPSGILEVSEENELDRDIVGHDLYGMIRHLHRPTMDFYRYTEWDNLTSEEKKYAKRMGYMSLLNFLNPNLYLKRKFVINDNLNGNFSVNYSLAPFGDFVEQNIYLNINNRFKVNPYFRQFFNRNYTFFGGGVGLQNFELNNKKILLNCNIDFWNQPKNFDFNTKSSDFGFGIKSNCGFRFSQWNQEQKSAYLNLGLFYKTKGFLPEAPSLKSDLNFTLGFTISTN